MALSHLPVFSLPSTVLFPGTVLPLHVFEPRYVQMVAAGHEMMRSAARLADEARELEKSNDSLLRTPHAASGEARRKVRLDAKPA